MSDYNLRKNLKDIADAIRDRLAVDHYPIQPVTFASEILDIPQESGGGQYDDPAPIIEGTIDYCSNDATAIKPYTFAFCSLLSGVSFPNCETIGSRVFYSCDILSDLSFPECKTISELAFFNCPRIEYLNSTQFPKVERIQTSAFQSCVNLSYVDLPECMNVGSSAFFSCSKLTSLNLPECVRIENNAFYVLSSLSYISIPKCEYVGTTAFYGCRSLSGCLYLPSLKATGNGAFSYCTNLTSVSLPECLYIGSNTFYSCSNIKSIYIPKVRSIYGGAFVYCKISGNLELPKCEYIAGFAGNRDIPSFSLPRVSFAGLNEISCNSIYLPKCMTGFFRFARIKNLDLPFITNATLNTDYNSAFMQGNTSLVSISAPLLAILGYGAFNGCSGQDFTQISLPAVTNISYGTFNDCYYLESIYLPNVSYVYSYSASNLFANCSKLSSLFAPTISYFGSQAFLNCSNLDTLILFTSNTRLGAIFTNVFANTPFTNSTYLGHYGSIYVPSQYLSNYKSSNYWSQYSDRIVALDSTYDAKYVYEGEFRSSAITEIPSEKINAEMCVRYAFYMCSNLTSVYLPECKYIQYYAFYSCTNISSLYLPKVEYIEPYNFGHCPNLTAVDLPKCRFIAGNVFSSNCNHITSISLPECVIIHDNNFNSINMSLLYLPKCSYIQYGFSSATISTVVLPKGVWVNGFGRASINSLYLLDEVGRISVNSNIKPNTVYVRENLLSEFVTDYGATFSSIVGLTDAEAQDIIDRAERGEL